MPPKPASAISFTACLLGSDLIFHTTWGLFSPKSIDEGTGLLLKYLDIPEDAVVLDLGCGYGPLGVAIAKHWPHSAVQMVDKDFVAIDFAQGNIVENQLANATTYLSNGFDQVPPQQRFDVIVSNLPAKVGKELLRTFLIDASERLNPGGQIYVVTISGLKEYMKRELTTVFGNYKKLKQSKTYTTARAIKA